MNRESRKRLSDLCKIADREQNGIFQHFQSNVTEYATREKYLTQRGGEPIGRSTDDLYGLAPEGDDSYMPEETKPNSLSTRYSPDRPGVQARRIADGVFQDPYTNKIYDYNDGFKTEDGRSFPGGSPALQSSMMRLSNHLDQQGLIKEADYLDALIKESASAGGAGALRLKAQGGVGIGAGGVAGIFAYLIGTEVLTPAAKAVWDRFPENTKTALQQVAAAVKAVPAGMAEDLKAGLRSALESALESLEPEEQGQVNQEQIETLIEAGFDGEVQASVKNYLIAFASHLDLRGLTEEADKLDCIVRSAK